MTHGSESECATHYTTSPQLVVSAAGWFYPHTSKSSYISLIHCTDWWFGSFNECGDPRFIGEPRYIVHDSTQLTKRYV